MTSFHSFWLKINHCIPISHFLYLSSLIKHIGLYHYSHILTMTLIHNDMQLSLRCVDLESFGYTLKSRATGSYDNSISSILTNIYFGFHSDRTGLYCNQQYVSVSFRAHPYMYLLMFAFILNDILIALRDLNVILRLILVLYVSSFVN